MSRDFWTDARIKELKALFRQGLTLGEIAKVFGITGNAAMGKARRLGLRRPRQRMPRTTRQPSAPRPEKLTPFADLRPDQCKFPFGDPKETGFGACGMPREPGKPYCAPHHALTHFTPPPREKATA